MRCWPIDPAAFRAPNKILLSRKNVRRNDLLDQCFRSWLQQRVAIETPGKQTVPGFNLAGLDDLAKLLAVAIARDENELGGMFLLEPPVSSQDKAIFPARGAN